VSSGTIRGRIHFSLRFISLSMLILFLLIMLFLTFFSRHSAQLLTIQVSGVSPGSQIINNVEYTSCLPLKALHQADGKTYVYLISDKETALGEEVVAEQLEVQIEDQNDEYAALNAGIASNQTVIVNANKPVADGERIHVKTSE
jgi:hypothetical protein